MKDSRLETQNDALLLSVTALSRLRMVVVCSAVFRSAQVAMNSCVRVAVVCYWVLAASAFGQDSRIRSGYGTIANHDQARRRETWLGHGRAVPGQSSAALRYRAYRQKL